MSHCLIYLLIILFDLCQFVSHFFVSLQSMSENLGAENIMA